MNTENKEHHIIMYNINDIDTFINYLLKEQENIYSIIDKEENTNYVEQYKSKDIGLLQFFDIIHFPQASYIQFETESSSVSYNKIIPFSIIKDENTIYLIYNGEKPDKETHKIPPFTSHFIGTIDKLNYDLNKLNKVTTEQLSDIVENGKAAFVINDEYYILNNI